jgi:pimeloyl-ACP methyl ester carboxylesterase
MSKCFTKLLWLCPFIFLCIQLQAQHITGTWQGSINFQGNQIPIVIHIMKDSSDKLKASFDSPNQHAFNLPCSEVMIKNDSVIIMMAVINGKYTGQLNKDDNQISGNWFQGAGSLPLTMNKTSETATVKEQKRPQTPKPPFSYHSMDVEYQNADKSIKYGATLTYPEIDSTRHYAKMPVFPAVILITGSGQQDRDETIFGHKSFAVIADYLTKNGFAVLRVDDRGMGGTTGVFSESTTADFVKDVEASLDFLEKQPPINKEKIGLIGHSEGGMIAPMVANERNEIKFIILLAGPGIPITDLMQQQIEAVSASDGKSPGETKANSFLMRTIWEELNKGQDSATTVSNIIMKFGAWSKTLDSATWRKISARDTTPLSDQINDAIAQLSSKWFKYFITFDPQPYLKKLSCKVLALNGSKDLQVIATSNLNGIRSSLRKSKSPKYDVIEIQGLNHLFQTCIKCNIAEYSELEESFSPKALEIMSVWLKNNVQ